MTGRGCETKPRGKSGRRKKMNNHRGGRARAVMDNLVNLVTVFDKIDGMTEKFVESSLRAEDENFIGKRPVSLSECHLLHHVGLEGHPNATRLAKALGMTKSGVSKLTAKLQKKRFILTERIPGNRKEIYYRLTADGEKIFRIHAKLHLAAEDKMIQVIRKYGEEDLAVIGDFLRKTSGAVHAIIREVCHEDGGVSKSVKSPG
jgi:DNA-binding MarR family transcriptional regulator